MSFSERVEQLDREIGLTVERAISELRREILDRLRSGSDQLLRQIEAFAPDLPVPALAHDHVAPLAQELTTTARRGALADLRDGLAAIDGARSQADILTALLSESRRFASRSAVLLNRSGELHGWGAQGFGDHSQAIRDLDLGESGDGAWGRRTESDGVVALSAADCADLCSRLESPVPHDGVLVPIVLRDRLAALLYADRLGEDELAVEALQSLAYVAAQAIESLPFRERASTSTLRSPGAPSAAPAAPAAPAAAPAEPVEPAPEPGTAPETAAPEPAKPAAEPVAAEAAASPEPAAPAWALPREEAPVSPEPPIAAATQAVAAQPEVAEVAETGAPAAVPEAAPEAPAEPAPEPAASQGAETVLMPRPVPSAGFTPPAREAEPEAEARPANTTAEVRPPSGVQGPGWAFATTRVPVSPDDEALHEEARRLARLLVSEIKLYNEEQVEEGRRNRDIYERLKEDIDRSRQMYEERVEQRVLRSTDYFYQELVRILAAGDSKALGI